MASAIALTDAALPGVTDSVGITDRDRSFFNLNGFDEVEDAVEVDLEAGDRPSAGLLERLAPGAGRLSGPTRRPSASRTAFPAILMPATPSESRGVFVL